jgi:hypothetical protein
MTTGKRRPRRSNRPRPQLGTARVTYDTRKERFRLRLRRLSRLTSGRRPEPRSVARRRSGVQTRNTLERPRGAGRGGPKVRPRSGSTRHRQAVVEVTAPDGGPFIFHGRLCVGDGARNNEDPPTVPNQT